MQRQTAVTAYFSSKQLLLFVFALRRCSRERSRYLSKSSLSWWEHLAVGGPTNIILCWLSIGLTSLRSCLHLDLVISALCRWLLTQLERNAWQTWIKMRTTSWKLVHNKDSSHPHTYCKYCYFFYYVSTTVSENLFAVCPLLPHLINCLIHCLPYT